LILVSLHQACGIIRRQTYRPAKGARPDREMIMTGLSSLMSVVARPQVSLSDRYLPLGIGCVPQFL
jgi:hypothetical protein